jgi:hypothetical protein
MSIAMAMIFWLVREHTSLVEDYAGRRLCRSRTTQKRDGTKEPRSSGEPSQEKHRSSAVARFVPY